MSHGAVKWNKRASLLYAIGVWTALGSVGFYTYRHRNDPKVEMPKEEEDARPNAKQFKSSYVSGTIVYKENFVPYSTRLLKFFGLTPDSSSGSQDNEK
ncbi:small integral membrane protein 26-like [Brachyhypopomus gauderio]|uniref:small integral membrane protein 26-like n=1 Tax=Brachyhypopomus gauderio TaxID=698409 RepID=UPI004042A8D7